MSLRAKFNLVLLLVFTLGVGASGYFSHRLLHKHATEETVLMAGSMMAAAMAIRIYTVEQIRPELNKVASKKFLPQTVPAYAATEVFQSLRSDYPDYTYKEATLNPTNPRDRATDWEADIITQFRNFPDRQELIGQRDTPVGSALYLARPIKITNESCLQCHSRPSAAPKSMIDTYGDSGGFDWKLNETVGAQIVSIPANLATAKANQAFIAYMGSLVAVFTVVFIALNILLGRIVIKPVTRLSAVADLVSTGKMDLPEFQVKTTDEIGLLAQSFNRMKRSLEKAMSMLNE